MKKFSWAAAVLLLVALGVLGTGCSTDKGPGSTPQGVQAGLVQIYMGTDTLTFLPGDSASTDGWVVVRDREGRAMSDVNVNLTLTQTEGPLGWLEFTDPAMQDCTDAMGRVYFRFRTFNQSGYNEVRAAVGQVADLWPIWVRESRDVVARLNLSLSKDNLQVAPRQEDSVMVTVTISDSSGRGVPNISLPVRASGGRLQPIGPTDPTGRAVTWWYSNGEYGDFGINVSIGGLQATDTVSVLPLPDQRGTVQLSTTTHLVRADHCVTRAFLTATLKNQRGVAIVGDTIYFATPDLGAVTAMGITDSLGKARAEFCEMDIPNEPNDSALVIARYERWGLADTVRIHIDEASAVSTINMRLNRTVGIAGVDSAAVTVSVFYEDGSRVNGRFLKFFATCGSVMDSVLLSNGAAVMPVYYRFCNQTTDASFQVWIWSYLDDAVSDSIGIMVVPGEARDIDIETDAMRISVGETMQVWGTVRDSLGNVVGSGTPVTFFTTLGSVDPPIQSTNTLGIANSTFSPGTSSGQAVLKASTGGGLFLDSMLVTVESGPSSTIRLGVSNPSPQVRETGGEDWTQLLAYVYDANGNPVPDGQVVYFQIIADPGGGCNINRRGTVDSSVTAGGIARATFNAGVTPGPVVIESYTWAIIPPDTFRYAARASNINIVSGPPAEIDVQAGVIGAEAQNGDAAWDVPLVALVTDAYHNPVRDSIAVFFSVDPDTASVLSDTVFTGNGLRRPGCAFSTLRYISAATNETVWITGRTAGNEEFPAVEETVPFVLPLQEPTISLYCLPSTWHFGAQGNPCRIECRSVVRDGHGVAINNSKVIYGTTRGRFYPSCTGGQEANYRLTGPVGSGDPTMDPGATMLCLREQEVYIFPDPQSPEITGDVQVEIEGYPDAIDSQTINYRR